MEVVCLRIGAFLAKPENRDTSGSGFLTEAPCSW
jgi:hypothetical protein